MEVERVGIWQEGMHESCSLAKRWLRRQHHSKSGENTSAGLPRSTNKLINVIKPFCIHQQQPSLDMVVAWLIDRGMLSLREGASPITMSEPTAQSSYDPYEGLPSEVKRRLERYWAMTLKARNKPTTFRSLLASMLQFITFRVETPVESVINQLIAEGWIQENSDGELVYNVPTDESGSDMEEDANAHAGDDTSLLHLFTSWIYGDAMQPVTKFDEVLSSFSHSCGVVDRIQLTRFLLSEIATSVVSIRWDAPESDPTKGSLIVERSICSAPSPQECRNFEDMVGMEGTVYDNLLRGIYGYGFEAPSSVQRQAVPAIRDGWDVFMQSQPGTGKSAALAIGVLHRVLSVSIAEKRVKLEEGAHDQRNADLDDSTEKRGRNPIAIIITRTRELAQQMHRVLSAVGSYLETCFSAGLLHHSLVGGASVSQDARQLKLKPLVVIGSLGRVMDMVKRKKLYVKDLKMLVIDDASSFFDAYPPTEVSQLNELCEDYLRSARPQLILSTTCNFDGGPKWMDQIRRLWRRTTRMHRPLMPTPGQEDSNSDIHKDNRPLFLRTVPRNEIGLDCISHFFVNVEREEWKLETFLDLYETITLTQAYVFTNTKRKVDWICDQATKRDFTCSSLHGDLAQQERDQVLSEFRSGSSRVLITNDLLAYGIDVHNANVVINYDIPTARELYIYRMGRIGRFGGRGVVINLVTNDQLLSLHEISQYWDLIIDELPADFAEMI